MKKTTLLKTLLMALMLVGGNVWAEGNKRMLDSQNYESAAVTDWTSTDATASLTSGSATYGTYAHCAWNSGAGGDRSAFKVVPTISGSGYTTASMTTLGYNVEFDICIRSGSKKNKSQSQFIVATESVNGVTNNSLYSGGYLFALTMPKFDDSDTYHTSWYINDLANSTGETVTLDYSKWFHVKLVVTATSVAYTITNNSTSAVVASGSKSFASMPSFTGFYTLMGYNYGQVEFDNFEVYDYFNFLSMTEKWGQDYRTITSSELSMSANSSDEVANGYSTGETYYYAPSLDEGVSAATNTNVGFYIKNSNGRQWRLAPAISSKLVQSMYSPISGAGTVHIYNLVKGQIVKVSSSSLCTGSGTLTDLSGYDNGTIRYYYVNTNGTGVLSVPGYGRIYSISVYDTDNEIIGALDNLTNYSTVWNTTPIWINAGETAYYKFKNYNNTSSANLYENWYLFAANESSTNLAIFGPNHTNTADGGNGSYTSKPTFTMSDLNGATVELTATLADAGDDTYTLTVTGVTTKADGSTTLSPNLVYTQKGLTVSKLKLYISPEKNWLELLQEAVSGTVTSAGWSTFASSNALDLSTLKATSDATAYYASNATGSTVTLKPTTAKVPAGEGIMVKGTAGQAFTIDVTASGTAIDGNLLKGQTATGNVAASTAGTYHYVFGFSKDDASVYGFYNLASATEVAAGKAYLETTTALTAGARSLSIVFDDEVTGIENLTQENLTPALSEGEGAFYDLQGRRVAQPTKGLYIVNGKKVVMK